MEQGSTKFAGLIVELLLARLLSPDAFGVLAIVTVFVNVFDAMSRNGLNTALIQSSDTSVDEYSTAFWLGEGIAVLAYAAISAASPFVASFYDMPELAAYLRVYSLVLFLNAFNSIQRAFLQKRFRFDGTFKVNLIAVVLSGIIGVAAAIMGFGTWSLVLQSLSNAAIACLAFRIVVPWSPTFTFNTSSAFNLLGYSWKTSASSVLNSIYSGAGNLILGAACSEHELGIYDRGSRYPQALITVLSSAISNVLLPLFSSLQGDIKAFSSEMRHVLCLGTFFIAPFSFFLAIIAEPGIRIILGDAWVETIPIFQIASIGLSVGFLQTVNQRALLALGRSDLYLKQEIGKLLLASAAVFGAALITRNIYIVAVVNYGVLLINVVAFDMYSARKQTGYGRSAQMVDVFPTFIAAIAAAVITLFATKTVTNNILKLVIDLTVYILVFLTVSCCIKNPAISYLKNMLARLRDSES